MIRSKLHKNVQAFADGVCGVYLITNIALPGKQPKERLTLKGTLCYDEKTVGIKRYEAGQAKDVEISRRLRTLRKQEVSTQDVVIDKGWQYRIHQIQYPEEAVPQCMDLSLIKVVENYEIP